MPNTLMISQRYRYNNPHELLYFFILAPGSDSWIITFE